MSAADGGAYPKQQFSSMAGEPPRYENNAYPQQNVQIEMPPGAYPTLVQPNVVTVNPIDAYVRDYLPWSIFNTLYMNFCCLGFVALVFSVRSRDRKLAGEKMEAIRYGSTARSLNCAATILTIILLVLFFILMISGTITLIKTTQNFNGRY
ncbi:dispanin subfamily A member 2b-like [Spea bombifrons]|uniref:dispanin subfamily A member 2b-like n=1 Tax=Spea bombifrons TaxID=233779 RepID=UPI00234A09A6|nr:dispanin subfamily A member 2b-like [Spea bombifrons]